MKLFGPFSSGAAAGSAGSATSNQDTPHVLSGRVLAVHVAYKGSSPPGTTDVIIATKDPANTILTLTNANTDRWAYPRVQIEDETGAGVTYDGTNEVYEPVPIFDRLNIKIDGADAGDSVDVLVLLD